MRGRGGMQVRTRTVAGVDKAPLLERESKAAAYASSLSCWKKGPRSHVKPSISKSCCTASMYSDFERSRSKPRCAKRFRHPGTSRRAMPQVRHRCSPHAFAPWATEQNARPPSLSSHNPFHSLMMQQPEQNSSPAQGRVPKQRCRRQTPPASSKDRKRYLRRSLTCFVLPTERSMPPGSTSFTFTPTSSVPFELVGNHLAEIVHYFERVAKRLGLEPTLTVIRSRPVSLSTTIR